MKAALRPFSAGWAFENAVSGGRMVVSGFATNQPLKRIYSPNTQKCQKIQCLLLIALVILNTTFLHIAFLIIWPVVILGQGW
jgi:hypothetical protein